MRFSLLFSFAKQSAHHTVNNLSLQRAWDVNVLHQKAVLFHILMAVEVPRLEQQETSTDGLMEQESFLQLTLPILVDGFTSQILRSEAVVVEVRSYDT